MLEANSGIHVSRSTIWRTLRAGGFTMKKVRTKHSVGNVAIVTWWSSFYALQLSIRKKRGSHTSTESAYTRQNSLFLLMRAPWIVEQHIEGQLGLFVVHRHSVKLSLFVADGKSLNFCQIHSVDSIS